MVLGVDCCARHAARVSRKHRMPKIHSYVFAPTRSYSSILTVSHPLGVPDIIHRDIKGHNILLKHGACKLADFGCSVKNNKGVEGATQTQSQSPSGTSTPTSHTRVALTVGNDGSITHQTAAGTMQWMAPEVHGFLTQTHTHTHTHTHALVHTRR